MLATVASLLTEWESYYVIVGSSGAALVGLQFVVLTLIAERRALASRDRARASKLNRVAPDEVEVVMQGVVE